MKFKEEFNKNLKFGIIAIGFVLLFFGGYYLNEVKHNFDQQCSFCITADCMNNDLKCGDFGEYFFKFMSLIGMSLIGIFIIIFKIIRVELEK